MGLTPVEIRHIRLGRGIFGYRRRATDGVLEELADSFEAVWRERADLVEEVERLEGDLVRFRELEALLRATLVSAERSASELRERAQREALLIVEEAHAEARAIVRRAAAEHERLQSDSSRLRALLQASLAALQAEEPDQPAKPTAEAA